MVNSGVGLRNRLGRRSESRPAYPISWLILGGVIAVAQTVFLLVFLGSLS